MVDLANYLYRALFLLGLAIAPRLLSPDPATPKALTLSLLLPLVALGGLLVGAYFFKKHLDSRESRIAGALVWVAVAAAVAGAVYLTGPRAPLARGAAPLALIVWPALAATAAALAGELLGSDWKHKRTAVTALVLAGGLWVHGDAAKNMGDAAHMWNIALVKDRTNETAFQRVTQTLMLQGKLDEVGKHAAACLRVDPASCTCLVAKATVAQRKQDVKKAVETGSDAAKVCPNVTAARAAYADALILAGRIDEALAEADEAILLENDPTRAHAVKARALLAAGKPEEAAEEAQKAVGKGTDRDATLQRAQIQINAGDLDNAETSLRVLQAANPLDTDVIYDLALIADKRGKYNEARNGYLAALKIDPTYKLARYNVARLTWRKGVKEEARNHAKKFMEIDPNDPAGVTLMQLVSSEPPPQGQ